jgi:DNA-binding NtrC family response regulator
MMSQEKKGILFVDDDPNLLAGLQRMLRGKREVWNMVFVGSGRDALAALSQERFDVIVADYKMPNMDGIMLLETVRIKYPAVKRILLTGQSEVEVYEQSKGIAQTYLVKPCKPDELISIINDA